MLSVVKAWSRANPLRLSCFFLLRNLRNIMGLYDIAIACSILHGIVLVLGYLTFSSISSTIQRIGSIPFRTFFTFSHLVIPNVTVCGCVACWMSVIYQNRALAVLFLCVPVVYTVFLAMIYMCSSLDDHGPTNKDLLHGRSEEYYQTQGFSHVDFANDLISRTYEFRAEHPDFEMESSPYLRERLARMAPQRRPPSIDR